MWKKLLKYRELAAGFVRKEVRNGKDISFWFDNWSPLGKLIDLTGQIGCIDMGITLHSTLSEVIENHRRRRHMIDNFNNIEAVIDEVQNSSKQYVLTPTNSP